MAPVLYFISFGRDDTERIVATTLHVSYLGLGVTGTKVPDRLSTTANTLKHIRSLVQIPPTLYVRSTEPRHQDNFNKKRTSVRFLSHKMDQASASQPTTAPPVGLLNPQPTSESQVQPENQPLNPESNAESPTDQQEEETSKRDPRYPLHIPYCPFCTLPAELHDFVSKNQFEK